MGAVSELRAGVGVSAHSTVTLTPIGLAFAAYLRERIRNARYYALGCQSAGSKA